MKCNLCKTTRQPYHDTNLCIKCRTNTPPAPCIECGGARRKHHITNLCGLCRHTTESLGKEKLEKLPTCIQCTLLIFKDEKEAAALGVSYYPHINHAHGHHCTGCAEGDLPNIAPHPTSSPRYARISYSVS